MSMHNFTDEFGEHTHNLLSGPPYEFKKPLTCVACHARLWAKRDLLCTKYGWDEWPEVCSTTSIPKRGM